MLVRLKQSCPRPAPPCGGYYFIASANGSDSIRHITTGVFVLHAMSPKIQGEASQGAPATRKRDACQAEIAAAGQSKKPGDSKPTYVDRMKLATAAATKRTDKAPGAIPRASDVLANVDRACIVQPDDNVASRIGNPHACFCFAVHTHGWPETSQSEQKGDTGVFGYYTVGSKDRLSYARIVQLGWAAGRDAATQILSAKTFTVKPDGFVISGEATEKHGISQAHAEREGRPLVDILREFMDDLDAVVTGHGARVVAHHLEFHATIVQYELGRAGLATERDVWARTARSHGYCTMNPELGRWLRLCNGEEIGGVTTKHTPALRDVAKSFWKQKAEVVTSSRDTTGTTASLLHRVFMAIVARAHGAKAALAERLGAGAPPLPAIIAGRLANPAEIISIDIETHGWPSTPTHVRIGSFGWHFCEEEGLCDFARIVQVGWVIGRADLSYPRKVKNYYIKPADFVVTPAATRFHGITHDFAVQRGHPLDQVLMELMEDAETAHNRGARLCAHHLEFDAGIILHELQNCLGGQAASAWTRIAMGGYCTMNADLGGWALPRLSKDVQKVAVGKRFLPLANMAAALKIPQYDDLLSRHHDASADAEVAFLIYAAALSLAG